jgi:hypothetical protein
MDQFCKQAKKFNAALNGSEEFKCSKGWLDRGKKRHGIRKVSITDIKAAEEFLHIFQEFVEREGFSSEQIFNADETALYFKMLPDKTLAEKNDANANKGFKQVNDRITLLFACNWTDTLKLKPYG